MIFLKRCKSKRVIAIVLGLILSFVNMLSTHGQIKEMNNYNKIKVVDNNMDKKSIGVKRQVANNSEIITINNKSYKCKKMRVTASAYTSSIKEGGSLTYLGTKCRDGVIAVDPKVIPLHSKVYIPSLNKVFIAEDVGSSIKNNKIDIWMNSYQKAMQWGLKQIDIYILE